MPHFMQQSTLLPVSFMLHIPFYFWSFQTFFPPSFHTSYPSFWVYLVSTFSTEPSVTLPNQFFLSQSLLCQQLEEFCLRALSSINCIICFRVPLHILSTYYWPHTIQYCAKTIADIAFPKHTLPFHHSMTLFMKCSVTDPLCLAQG